jgi:hypothetical protein
LIFFIWKNIVFRLYTFVSIHKTRSFLAFSGKSLSGYMSPSTWLKSYGFYGTIFKNEIDFTTYILYWIPISSFASFHKIHYFCVFMAISTSCSFPSWNLPYKFWPFTWL